MAFLMERKNAENFLMLLLASSSNGCILRLRGL